MAEVVVVGGGIAGAAAARLLRQCGHHVTIVEKNDRLGGRICSQHIDDVTFEAGAGFLTSSYTQTLRLVSLLGLDSQLVKVSDQAIALAAGGVLRPVSLLRILDSSLLSWRAKATFALLVARVISAVPRLDPHAIWRAYDVDRRSVAELLDKPSDHDLLNYVVGPILDGYFYWTPQRTAAAVLLWVLRAIMFSRDRLTLAGGLQQIPESASEGSEVLLGHEVQCIRPIRSGGWEIGVRSMDGSRTLSADGVVCAVPAPEVVHIVEDLSSEQRRFFGSIRYSSTVVQVCGIHVGQSRSRWWPVVAFPHNESRPLTSITSKVVRTHNVDRVVKLYASGSAAPGMWDNSDDDIVAALTSAAATVGVDVATSQRFQRLYRWPEALPEFDVGYLATLHSFAGHPYENQRLVFAGDYLGGPFIEGALISGVNAAKRLTHQLSS